MRNLESFSFLFESQRVSIGAPAGLGLIFELSPRCIRQFCAVSYGTAM